MHACMPWPRRLQPGPTNEYHATTETWAAFVDEHDCGVGLAFKEPCQITTYRCVDHECPLLLQRARRAVAHKARSMVSLTL
jgi:hypothetical protein